MNMIPKPDIRTELMLIDAAAASTLLAMNTHNRPPKKVAVAAYARDMRAGNWRFTAEPIVFSNEGVLLDGQNRLMAVQKSDTRIWFLIVYGVDERAQHNMDAGAKRSFADTLNLREPGVGNANSVAALTRAVFLWENGGVQGGKATPMSFSSKNPTIDELMQVFDANEPALVNAVKVSRRIWDKRRGMSGATYALAYYLFDALDQDMNVIFWDHIINNNAPAGSPIAVLSDSILRWATVRDKPSGYVQLAIVIKAWNHWQDGQTPKQIRFAPAIETMPVPHAVVN